MGPQPWHFFTIIASLFIIISYTSLLLLVLFITKEGGNHFGSYFFFTSNCCDLEAVPLKFEPIMVVVILFESENAEDQMDVFWR